MWYDMGVKSREKPAKEAMTMRCSCQNCGAYMVQDEKGLGSRCICPECFTTCSACMGTPQKPADKEQLQYMMLERERYDAEHENDD